MTDAPRNNQRLPLTRRRCLRELAVVWHGGWQRLRARLWIIVVASALGSGLVWVGNDADKAMLEKVRLDDDLATQTADFVSNYTSDLALGVPLSLALWFCGFGATRNRSRWRRLGLACLMATLMSGLCVTVVKRVVGRPRPMVTEAYLQGIYGTERHPFYGFTLRSKLHSFPSGHTGTSTATGVSLMAANPILIVPGVAYAATVGWSRMQLRKHHPLDVAFGAVIGIVCGLSFASAVPGSKIKLRRRKRARPGRSA
jgi:membrane-associated phospholipid phosphatase